MSTSDQNEGAPLTRKQMRELRLTGSTPVITEEEAAVVPPPSEPEPAPVPPVPVPEAPADLGLTPMTRRQAREQERVRTASVPVIAPIEEPVAEGRPATETSVTDEPVTEESASDESEALVAAPDPAEGLTDPVLSEAPVFPRDDQADGGVAARPDTASAQAALAAMFGPSADFPAAVDEDDEGIDDPVSSSVFEPPRPATAVTPEESPVFAAEPAPEPEEEPGSAAQDEAAQDTAEDGAAQVGPAFGRGVSAPDAEVPTFSPSFDDIVVGDSTGSHHAAPNALIFTQGPTEGSLSGPVASTGELLITGTYELPRGIGSQGHAIGAADGKEVDAVLIDGELAPTSSPTPIAASSAVSTSKPAGEVIRPPVPEKSNKLMLVLAIVAGGLALALAAALVAVFFTNVLGR